MSPRQQSQRRLEIEQHAVNKIIAKEWTSFYSDEGRRAKTVPELVAALRALKTRLQAQLKAEKYGEWVESTAALIDIKIEEVIALGDKKTELKPAKKPKASFWLPFKKRGANPEPPASN